MGDLILLKLDEAVPADLVLLGSSNDEGCCMHINKFIYEYVRIYVDVFNDDM